MISLLTMHLNICRRRERVIKINVKSDGKKIVVIIFIIDNQEKTLNNKSLKCLLKRLKLHVR